MKAETTKYGGTYRPIYKLTPLAIIHPRRIRHHCQQLVNSPGNGDTRCGDGGGLSSGRRRRETRHPGETDSTPAARPFANNAKRRSSIESSYTQVDRASGNNGGGQAAWKVPYGMLVHLHALSEPDDVAFSRTRQIL